MSEIKVNKISQRSGTAITLGNSGTDFQLPSGADIVAQSGSTITIAAGATITNSGTATGFGPTGAVSWNTTAVTSSPLTAASGVGYFINTSGGAITVNLPVGVAGAIISLADYTNTWQTNNVTVNANGSEKIGGVAGPATLNIEGQSVTFIYVDSTEGWKNVQDSTSNVVGNAFIQATGGTVTTCGNCKIHTFTGPGTFTVSATAVCSSNNVVSYMLVAGGGGGGAGGSGGGGGGGGGFREIKNPVNSYTASPLDGYPSAPNRITVTATSFPITVGSGGAGGTVTHPGGSPQTLSTAGNNSVFSTITAAGGGRGGDAAPTGSPNSTGGSGGSGGGGTENGPTFFPGGSGNTPPTSPAQGFNGGNAGPAGGGGGSGGGGGATQAGTTISPSAPANGGNGATTSISGSPTAYAGGGGGGSHTSCNFGTGGTGGGGNAAPNAPAPPYIPGFAGTTNRGGGGGGGTARGNAQYLPAGNGGSGIVVIRYKYQ